MVLTASPPITFTDHQDAVDAPYKELQWTVLIGGVVTDCTAVTTRYDVDAPIGTATLTLPLPLPAHVTLGATVEVQAGWPGVVGTIFRGRIPRRRQSISQGGYVATITASSLGARLARMDYVDVRYAGLISLKRLFEAMCARRQVEMYRSDLTTSPDGTKTIFLGGNYEANGGQVRIPRKTQTSEFLTRTAALFGYRVFDTAEGVRQKRISGRPSIGDVAFTVAEAWNATMLAAEDDIDGLVNYWEVFGARYQDGNGVEQALRSIPAVVPHDDDLEEMWGEGWARDEVSNEIIDTIALADIVRNVREIDHSEPRVRVRWTTHGAPYLMPGDAVLASIATMDVLTIHWLMRVEHTIDQSGFSTTCESWRGAGEALPAGEDCVTTAVPGGPWHVGDETVPWYHIPTATSRQISIPFTVHEYYSSIAVYGLAHGCNSYLLGGQNTDAEVSRFEVWQFGEKVGSGNLPILDENYARQLPYGSGDTHWSEFVIPIGGNLEPGQAELRILSGEDSRLPESTKWDDFEVKSLSLRTCGVGTPVYGEEDAP